MKQVALSSGNFKNICRTIAVWHQMRQAERLMSARGFSNDENLHISCRTESMTLNELSNGLFISQLLGHYELFRELFTTDCVSVNGISYKTGDVLVSLSDEADLYPKLLKIDAIYISDSRECSLICKTLLVVNESHHYQAYEIVVRDEITAVKCSELQLLLLSGQGRHLSRGLLKT